MATLHHSSEKWTSAELQAYSFKWVTTVCFLSFVDFQVNVGRLMAIGYIKKFFQLADFITNLN